MKKDREDLLSCRTYFWGVVRVGVRKFVEKAAMMVIGYLDSLL